MTSIRVSEYFRRRASVSAGWSDAGMSLTASTQLQAGIREPKDVNLCKNGPYYERSSAGGDRTCDSLQVLRPFSNISAHCQRPDLPLFGQSRTRIVSGVWLTFSVPTHDLRRKSSTDTWCYTMSRQSRHQRTASTVGGASLYRCQKPEDRRHLSDGKSELCTGNDIPNPDRKSVV